MKSNNKILLISLFFLSLLSATKAQNNQRILPLLKPVIKRDTFIVLEKSQLIYVSKPEKKADVSPMPWIFASIVGVLTILANIYISYAARKTSIEINRRDFNKTILSANRQIWISEFRGLMSEIISKYTFYIAKASINDLEFSEINLLLTKVELLITNSTTSAFTDVILKLRASSYEILKENSHIEELDSLLEELKIQTRETIKNEWELVKNGN